MPDIYSKGTPEAPTTSTSSSVIYRSADRTKGRPCDDNDTYSSEVYEECCRSLVIYSLLIYLHQVSRGDGQVTDYNASSTTVNDDAIRGRDFGEVAGDDNASRGFQESYSRVHMRRADVTSALGVL